MSTHVYRREGGEKKVRNSVYVECERPLTWKNCPNTFKIFYEGGNRKNNATKYNYAVKG